MALKSTITISDIVRNVNRVYQGDLTTYFRTIFKASSVKNPYHGIRHTLHVMWMCHDACMFYQAGPWLLHDIKLNERDARNILIAALFHDYGHSGTKKLDKIQIDTAVEGFRWNVLPEDFDCADEVESLIRSTEYPHRHTDTRKLPEQILRDADLVQALDRVWIQNVIFGLASEWQISPQEMLRKQILFLRELRFETSWARARFSEQDIADKIRETEDLIRILG